MGQDNTCRISYDQKQAEDSETDRYKVTGTQIISRAVLETSFSGHQAPTNMMAYLILLFLPCVLSARAVSFNHPTHLCAHVLIHFVSRITSLSRFQRILVPGFELSISQEPYRESRKGRFHLRAVLDLEERQ